MGVEEGGVDVVVVYCDSNAAYLYGKKMLKRLVWRVRAEMRKNKKKRRNDFSFCYDPLSYALNFDDGGVPRFKFKGPRDITRATCLSSTLPPSGANVRRDPQYSNSDKCPALIEARALGAISPLMLICASQDVTRCAIDQS
ncbi:hypothetical protein C2S52_015860 [Perilla frutescens var. hirtella]|nr:hypothetical protein C2S52_015860 [Perilla frutescens var. hirtella]